MANDGSASVVRIRPDVLPLAGALTAHDPAALDAGPGGFSGAAGSSGDHGRHSVDNSAGPKVEESQKSQTISIEQQRQREKQKKAQKKQELLIRRKARARLLDRLTERRKPLCAAAVGVSEQYFGQVCKAEKPLPDEWLDLLPADIAEAMHANREGKLEERAAAGGAGGPDPLVQLIAEVGELAQHRLNNEPAAEQIAAGRAMKSLRRIAGNQSELKFPGFVPKAKAS